MRRLFVLAIICSGLMVSCGPSSLVDSETPGADVMGTWHSREAMPSGANPTLNLKKDFSFEMNTGTAISGSWSMKGQEVILEPHGGDVIKVLASSDIHNLTMEASPGYVFVRTNHRAPIVPQDDGN